MTGANAKIKRILVRPNGVEKQVRPYRYNPGSNTLLYMPLNGNVKDEVSGNNGTWSGTAQYQTLASGLKVANCTTSSYIDTPSFTFGNTLTVSGWLYRNSGHTFVRCDGKTGTRNFYQISYTSDTGAGGGWYYSGSWYGANSSSTTGWKYIVLTCGSSGLDVYVNGSSIYHNAVTSFVGKTQARGINHDQYSTTTIPGAGYYSELIVESRAWSATEVLNYYNQTKANYGL